MASIREAFTNPDVAQGDFYSAQQIRYREVEPNRFLPDKMKANLGPAITNAALAQFNTYDPYTQKVSNKFSAAGLRGVLQGQANTTDEETFCRGFTGAASLPKLMVDQDSSLPIRCGWRYKKSPGGGLPQVSQGALGTVNGPLNPQSDPLGNGVEWIWDLKKAYDRHAKDFRATLPASSTALQAAQTSFPSTAWCSQTNTYISLDAQGKPLPGYTCAATNIVTNPANFPQVNQTAASSLASANSQLMTTCMRPGNNPSLSRDCLLLAVKTNGCSTDGALYQAIESAKPNATSFATYLQTQPSFITYQSKQGDNKITADLFNRERGSWDTATREIQKLQRYTQTAQDPSVKIAAQDLCLFSGNFDQYDFCSEISESANIASVDLKCLQSYWQEKNGKPAGLLYPKSKTLKPQLGAIATWGQYRNAIDQLKTKTNSTDGLEQRAAINNFLGVTISNIPFSPLNLDNIGQQLALGGQPVRLWLDAKDASTLTIDGNNRVKTWADKSGRNNTMNQNGLINRPIYRQDAFPGLEFDGSQTFMDIPNAAEMVLGNFTIFVVERRKSGKALNYFMGGTTVATNTNLVLGYRGNTVATMAFYNNDVDVSVPSFSNSLEPIRLWAFEKTTGGRNIYLNGQRIGGDTNLATLMSWNGASLGRLASTYYQGSMYEVIFYNPGLSMERRQKVEGYLAHKWGLSGSLMAGHPYKVNAP